MILNLLLVIVLTPVFNALGGGRKPIDETVPADYAGLSPAASPRAVIKNSYSPPVVKS